MMRAASIQINTATRARSTQANPETNCAWVREAAEKSRTAGLRLLRSGQYSDLKICCGPREWSVHENILGPRCGFFGGCLRAGFKEAETSVIHLDDDDPDAVDGLLQYLYTFSYPEPPSSSTSSASLWSAFLAPQSFPEEEQTQENPHFLRHPLYDLNVYMLSQKYLLPHLRTMCYEVILDRIALPNHTASSDNHKGYFDFLSNIYSLTLPSSLTSHDSFAQGSSEESDIAQLHAAVPATITDNWEWMIEQEAMREMLEEMPDLALAVMRGLGKKASGVAPDKKMESNRDGEKSWNGGDEADDLGMVVSNVYGDYY